MMQPLKILNEYMRVDAKKLAALKQDLLKMNASLTHVSLDRFEQACFNIFGED